MFVFDVKRNIFDQILNLNGELEPGMGFYNEGIMRCFETFDLVFCINLAIGQKCNFKLAVSVLNCQTGIKQDVLYMTSL